MAWDRPMTGAIAAIVLFFVFVPLLSITLKSGLSRQAAMIVSLIIGLFVGATMGMLV